MFRRGTNTKRPRFSVGGHVVFEHDDSSNHSGHSMAEYDDDSSSQQHLSLMNSSDPNFSFGQFHPDRPRRAPKSITKLPNDDNTNLNACLDHLLRILSRKDKEGFFQYPVTDQFAPGYSQIITRPMDFSTMKKKMSQDEYYNVLEFRSDFELMCENAMKYNRPDTIYWQAAKKLLATGTKLMHKDKLISFRRSLECFSRLTERELGFRIDSSNHATDEQNEPWDTSLNDSDNLSSMSVSQACSQRKPKLILKLPKFYDKPASVAPPEEEHVEEEEEEEEEEEFSPDEILAQARSAAQCAHEKLRLRQPIVSYTLAYRRKNGSTALKYINQEDFSKQTITLDTISRAETSLTTLPIASENDKRQHFLENGPFSSNASQYDSTFSSTPKEELELLIHTYGSEFSAQYAVSLMDYVKDAGDLALAYVDRFLSVLTNGEHDNLLTKRREKNTKVEAEDDGETIESNSTTSLLPSHLSPDQIKLESNNDHVQHPELDEDSKLFPQLPQTNEPVNDYTNALFNLNDMTQMSNGTDQLIGSDPVHFNLGIGNNSESSLDAL